MLSLMCRRVLKTKRPDLIGTFLIHKSLNYLPIIGDMSDNVRHIRSFSEAERKKNLGEKILLSLIYYKVQNF